jgi:hypothetical protein
LNGNAPMKEIVIPRHEPEIISARIKKCGGGDQYLATTSIRSLKIAGVLIVSRYRRADEFARMQKMVLSLPGKFLREVKSILCDSKVSHCYFVVLRRWDSPLARTIGLYLEHQARMLAGGHNGIQIRADDGSVLGDPEKSTWVDCCWELRES